MSVFILCQASGIKRMNRAHDVVSLFLVFLVMVMSRSHSMTDASGPKSCTVGFLCNNKECINDLLRCDGVDDCGDYSDESNCTCGSGRFVCDNGRCVQKSWVCDGDDDCLDNSDERNCTGDVCANNGGCSHKCTVIKDKRNRQTGRKCDCRKGFYLLDDDVTCEDIDECTKVGVCDEQCINTVGSYKCGCKTGFKVGTNQTSCNGYCANNGGCSHKCTVIKDKRGRQIGRKCVCRKGFYLRDDGVTCEDVDECTKIGICDGKCINTVGSYKCECKTGFKVGADPKSCIDVNECDYKNGECEHLCHNNRGSYTCSCKRGYTQSYLNPKHCLDKDECALGVPNCHQCINIAGGYTCICETGFTASANKTRCLDIDECVESNGGCEHICFNTPGSYECHCKPGFEAVPKGAKTCTDVNECQGNRGRGQCRHRCINAHGSYYCECPTGYKLNKDGHSCDDVDECRLKGEELCNHTCVNAKGRYYCTCKPGYFLAADGKTCRDTVDYSECGISRGLIQETRRWKNTDMNDWPWIVFFKAGYFGWLSMDVIGALGVILSEKWVLTAAHSLHTGMSYTLHTNNNQHLQVAEIIPYSDCEISKIKPCKADIALLKLEKPIKFAEGVRPICMPDRATLNQVLRDRSKSVGMILQRNAHILRKRTVRLRRSRDCSRFAFSRYMICAGDARNECPGDSGSPLMFSTRKQNNNDANEKTIVYLGGVLSWGMDLYEDEKCGSKSRHLAYTNVVKYLKWIYNKTGIKQRK